jgi:predicted nucleic acid-binding protein
VVDASVVAKWVLPIEPFQDNALKLKAEFLGKKVDLFAPTLLTIELTNVLWKAVKLKRLQKQDAVEALSILNDIQITLCETDWIDASQIINIAFDIDCAVYDATYLFLTDKLKAKFITADEKLYEKAKTDFQVIHAKDF